METLIIEFGDKKMPSRKSNKDIFAQIAGEKKEEDTKRKLWSELPVEKWDWLHFLEYWDARYMKTLNILSPGRSKYTYPRLKGTIEPSRQHWGNEIFKAMIDYVFDNLAYYPQWDNPTIGLVCGKHYWVQEISRKVQQKGGTML